MAQVKERAGGGEEREETLADKPLDFENRPLGLSWLTVHAPTFDAVISCSFLPFPLPPLSFFGSLLISRAIKPKLPFHGLFLFRNQTETLPTQATHGQARNMSFICMRIERRRMTSCYHGSTIFGGQQNQRRRRRRRRRQGERQKKKKIIIIKKYCRATRQQLDLVSNVAPCRAELNS